MKLKWSSLKTFNRFQTSFSTGAAQVQVQAFSVTLKIVDDKKGCKVGFFTSCIAAGLFERYYILSDVEL